MNTNLIQNKIFQTTSVPQCNVFIGEFKDQIIVPGWLAVFSRGGAVSFASCFPDEIKIELFVKYGVENIVVINGNPLKCALSWANSMFEPQLLMKHYSKGPLPSQFGNDFFKLDDRERLNWVRSELLPAYYEWSQQWETERMMNKSMKITILNCASLEEIESYFNQLFGQFENSSQGLDQLNNFSNDGLYLTDEKQLEKQLASR